MTDQQSHHTLTRSEIQKLQHDVMIIKNDLKILNERSEFQLRMERLDFALQHVEMNSFNYYDKEHKKVNSSVLVRNIIFWWRRGVNACSTLQPNSGSMRMKPSIDEMPHMRQAFRDRLVGQLHELTGGTYLDLYCLFNPFATFNRLTNFLSVRPRLEYNQDNDEYWLFYE
jgi:hypothetical protein